MVRPTHLHYARDAHFQMMLLEEQGSWGSLYFSPTLSTSHLSGFYYGWIELAYLGCHT